MLREIVALRPEIASLAAELSDGPARSAAARNVMVGLVAELFAARATKMFTTQLPLREHVIDQLQGKPAIDASPSKALPLDHPDVEPKLAGQLWSLKYLVRTNEEVTRSFGDLSVGRIPRRAWRAPLYRSNRISAASGVRAGAYFLIAAAAFSFSGWPMTYVALSFVAIIVGRGATMPDPRAFTTMAVVGAPIAALMTGILEFVVLDGSTAFPLLAICLAPFIIGAALLVTLPSRIWSALGRFNLIFILVLLAPSNPQTYDPQTFLLSVLLLLLATGLLFVMQMLIPPLSSDRCREWLQASASRDLQNLPSRWQQNLAPEEAMFRDAGRIARFLAAGSNAQEGGDAVEAIMAIFDRSAILRLCDAELDRLKNGPLGIQVGAAREALEARDARSILSSAQALQRAPAGGASATSVSAVLALAGAAFASDHTDFPTDGSP